MLCYVLCISSTKYSVELILYFQSVDNNVMHANFNHRCTRKCPDLWNIELNSFLSATIYSRCIHLNSGFRFSEFVLYVWTCIKANKYNNIKYWECNLLSFILNNIFIRIRIYHFFFLTKSKWRLEWRIKFVTFLGLGDLISVEFNLCIDNLRISQFLILILNLHLWISF